MRKPTILIFVHYYLPGYKAGGPGRSIGNLVEALGDEFDFRIITADRDWLDAGPYESIKVGDWNRVGKAQVFYCCRKHRRLGSFRVLIHETQPDILYLNSFLNPVFTLKPLFLRYIGSVSRIPVVIAPRGEFSNGALEMESWKKTPYVQAIRLLGLFRGLTWQASSEFEAHDIRRALGAGARRTDLAQNVWVAPDVASKRETSKPFTEPQSKSSMLRVLFLSRITPMKNLEGALRILSQVKSFVDFSIVGPIDEQNYWIKCRALIQKLPQNIRATYSGPLEPSAVPHAMAQHDLFFLPTLGENFGHVIPEALAAGLPVLISNRTPWRDLEAKEVGWDLPLEDGSSFAEKIDLCAGISPQEYDVWRDKIRNYASQFFFADDSVEKNRRLFLGAVNKTAFP